MRRDQLFNPVMEGVMDCGTAYPTCWSGSRVRAVSIKRGSTRRKGTGRLWRTSELSVLVSVALLFSSQLALAQFSQQQKLVGTGAIGNAGEGMSVSLSSDGNTAIVGGPYDDGEKGAAWVYTRSGGVWTQQDKLVGKQAIGIALLGGSVSVSSDGNTAIVGGPYDDGGKGAAWVYTRSGGSWTQQQKLACTNPTPQQVLPVSVSSDGNTAILGGPYDDGAKGAAWVYTRSGGSWTQQSKLVGTGANAQLGASVSVSSDGNTAILGGPLDDGGKGAAWVYTRSGGSWTQQSKLVDTGAIGNALQGGSVSVSSDGNTAILGGKGDEGGKGAAWVYTRSGGSWTQQSKLVGTGAIGDAWQGHAVSLSSDGNTAIVGGPFDDEEKGAAWVYTRSGGSWTQQGSKLVDTGAMWAKQGMSVSVSSDGNTVIVGGPFDNGDKGAAWVYVRQKHLYELQWWAKYVAIDPMALILKGKALDIWYEIHHPHEPKVAEIQRVLRSMTPEEQKATLNRARTLENYAKAEERMVGFMPPEEQKAALNRARTLENYGKAVEEAFATIKK
jgi:FG-GAP repeat